jgi:hypothetical protein
MTSRSTATRSPGGKSSVENLSGVLPLMFGFIIQPV